MTRDVIVAPPTLSVANAWRTLQREGIRHLPITESNRLVGIVSDRDLLCAGDLLRSGELAFWEQSVAEIMTREPIVCTPNTSVAVAAQLMVERKIDALPVVLDGRLVGLVTSTDLLLLLADQAPVYSLPLDFRVRETRMVA